MTQTGEGVASARRWEGWALLLVLQGALIGSLSSSACGVPWRMRRAVAVMLCSIVLGAWVVQRRGGRRSEATEYGVIVAAGGLVLLAAHSGPGLLLLTLAAWGLTRIGRGEPGDGVALAAGVWLAMAAADFVQRGAFSGIPIVAGVSVGVLAGLIARPDGVWGLALGALAYAWAAWWWWIDWLPMNAWWALGPLPLSLASPFWPRMGGWSPNRVRRSLAWGAAALHGVGMAAAFGAVALLR